MSHSVLRRRRVTPWSDTRGRARAPRTKRTRVQRTKKERSWKEFREHLRADPKAGLEGDLKAVVVGLVIAFFGSVFVGGTFYWTALNTQPGPAMPIFGTIIFFIGGVVVITGLIMAVLCLGVNFWGWLSKETHHDRASSPPPEAH